MGIILKSGAKLNMFREETSISVKNDDLSG